MKVFTRQLYERMQTDWEGFEEHWRGVCERNRRRLNQIFPKLPPGMRKLIDNTLHDGVVLAVGQPTKSELFIDVDASNNPWGPRDFFRLRFTGVRKAEGIADLVDRYWLYEEVHLHRSARFDFRVLFDRSEFRVVADDVSMRRLPKRAKEPGGGARKKNR